MLYGIKPFPLSFLLQLAHVSSVDNCSFQASILKEIVSLIPCLRTFVSIAVFWSS